MNTLPLVSVIIPTYNRAHLIGETLDSVLAQNYPNWECLIIDDGSADRTIDVVENYAKKDSRFKYYQRPDQHLPGGNGARNYGLKVSQGSYIQWFDSDDLMDKNLLAEQIKSITLNDADMSICLHERYNYNFTKIKVKSKQNKITNTLYYDYILKSINLNLPTILLKKGFLKGLELREDLQKSQELEFLQRILKIVGKDFIFLNKPLVKVRRHSDSITGTLNEQRLESLLKVSCQIIKELPSQTPKNIKRKLFLIHTQNLRKSFLNKKTRLFLIYLFQVPEGFERYKLWFLSLYLVYYFTGKGRTKYKRIQAKIL